MRKGIGGHQSAIMKTDVWLTPPEILRSLGEFDLDPCSPIARPWNTANKHYTIEDDGLALDWFGQVWLNPPYGKVIGQWMKKMSTHGQGVALIFARTETDFFQRFVFPFADSLLFLCGRLNFCNALGMRSRMNAGAPSVLIAYGEKNVDRLADSGLKGKHVPLNAAPVVIVGVSPTWKAVITIAVGRLNGEAALAEIYDLVEQIAPDKVQANGFFREKIRQELQKNFSRVSKGIYRKA